MEDVEFCLLVERGRLERRAIALVKSIRMFSGRYRSSAITVVSPRADRRPSEETKRALDTLNVNYVEFDLRSPVPKYGPSFKTFALAQIERRSGPEILIQIDTDTVFCAEPDLGLEDCVAAVRPVDVKGMCSSGPGDPLEVVWGQLADLAGISLAAFPYVETTASKERVRASYNGGLLVARRRAGVYQLTASLFSKILNADIKLDRGKSSRLAPVVRFLNGTGINFLNMSHHWGTTQVAFSLALERLGGNIRVLTAEHNVPLNLDITPPRNPRHLHYHDILSSPQKARTTFTREIIARCSPDFQRWLSEELPL